VGSSGVHISGDELFLRHQSGRPIPVEDPLHSVAVEVLQEDHIFLADKRIGVGLLSLMFSPAFSAVVPGFFFAIGSAIALFGIGRVVRFAQTAGHSVVPRILKPRRIAQVELFL
jgi:hypothetical protein